MTEERDDLPAAPPRRVASEHAEPSRPGGYEGVRQPLAASPVPPPEHGPGDGALTEAVRAALAADGRLAGSRIEAVVRGGRAVLTGRVRVEFQRELATARAGEVAGVLVVMNRLEVAEPGPLPHDETRP